MQVDQQFDQHQHAYGNDYRIRKIEIEVSRENTGEHMRQWHVSECTVHDYF
jgi:hypothetical protein